MTDDIQIFIGRLTGDIHIINTNINDTIKTVKDKIFKSENIPSEQQILIYNHEHLKDENTLSDYKIQNETTIFLILELRGGGGCAPNVDKFEIKVASTKKDEYAHNYYLYEGLTFGGICENKTCKYFGEMVSSGMNYGKFDLIDIKGNCVCFSTFNVTAFYLSQCEGSLTYNKKDKPALVKKIKISGDSYIEIGDGENVEYDTITLEIYKNDKKGIIYD